MKPLKPYLYGKNKLVPHKCFYVFQKDSESQYVSDFKISYQNRGGLGKDFVQVDITISKIVTGKEVDVASTDGFVEIDQNLKKQSDRIKFVIDDQSGGSNGGDSTAHYGDFD